MNCDGKFFAAATNKTQFYVVDMIYLLFVSFSPDSWNLELKTIETVGMVLYNSAVDFIALEIVNSRLRFLVGKGSNAVELVSDRNVTDGKWHNVSIAYSPFLVEVCN